MTQMPDQPSARAWHYDSIETAADGVVHATGLLLATVGTVLLFALRGDMAVVPRAVYCASLLVALAVSAAYNLWPVSPLKWRLRRLDHAMIFGLIAGTYTPFLSRIGTLQTTLLLAAIWIVSLFGIGLKLADVGRRERLSTVLYVALGWSGLLAIKTLADHLPPSSLWLIVAGGLLYSLGSIFHHWRALRFQNVIWHGFVLAAATCHFCAVAVMADA